MSADLSSACCFWYLTCYLTLSKDIMISCNKAAEASFSTLDWVVSWVPTSFCSGTVLLLLLFGSSMFILNSWTLFRSSKYLKFSKALKRHLKYYRLKLSSCWVIYCKLNQEWSGENNISGFYFPSGRFVITKQCVVNIEHDLIKNDSWPLGMFRIGVADLV